MNNNDDGVIMKIAFISASLGELDDNIQNHHAKQNLPNGVVLDKFYFTDENFHPRKEAMSPRLQAKIPKMLGWDLVPGYDIYIWADAVITLSSQDAVNWLLGELGDNDIALFKHPENRKSIRSELEFMHNHMNGLTNNDYAIKYLKDRYRNEDMEAQVDRYTSDDDFVDNSLYSAGLFIYRNTEKVQRLLKEWYYENTRWSVQDQLSLPYVLSKSNVSVGLIDSDITNNQFTTYYWRSGRNTSKWNDFYKRLPENPSAFVYGDTCTYEMGAEFLKDCRVVEDWGTGAGGFKRFRKDSVGIDGSNTPFADIIADLVKYRSNVEGIFIRHVLEHNKNWRMILRNALESFSKRMVIIFFTPMTEGSTCELIDGSAENAAYGIEVPNISISSKELNEIFSEYSINVSSTRLNTDTNYHEETIYFFEKI